MRIIAITSICLASLLANPYIDVDLGNVGAGALLLWPTARSTRLAGAMTGLADEADAAFFNPAGLASQTTAKADITYANWLPGLYPGMYYASAHGGTPLKLVFLGGRKAYVAVSLTFMTVGEEDIVNEHGDFLGRVTVWRGAVGGHAGLMLTNTLAIGVGLKLVRSSYYSWWSWLDLSPSGPRNAAWLPETDVAIAAAVDCGIHFRPVSRVSIGASVTNLGPSLVYRPSRAADDLPRMARLGLCWTPVENRNVRLRVMPELDKVLVGMFSDTTGKSFGRQLNEEWHDVSKALGVEMTVFDLVSIRLAYLEDLSNEKGGLIYQREGWYSQKHYGLWDVIARRDIGQFKSIGLCWGFGFGTDKLRFDFSSDAAIYDFPTTNWKLQLTCNDIGGLFRRKS